MRSTVLKAVLLTACLAGFAWAGDDDDGRGRGIARISVIQGDVSVRRGDSGEWVAAAVNAPLVVEDRVSSGATARAEVQFDYANMLRLAANTEVRLSELEHRRYQVQVARGTVMFRVLRDSDAEVEISTPNVSVRPLKRGSYRVTVREDGDSEITVRSGEAEIFTPRGAERLKSGRTMVARGSASDPEFHVASAIERDNWDRWNEDRDQYLDRTRAYRYVNRSVYGADELDDYGNWDYVQPYGWVWAPRVAAGWSPYYDGRWSWVDWYGWSWVSYDPWGWAPYHYGRWFNHGNRWCWWPGGMYTQQYWRPGLVAFFGWGGGGLGIGAGFGYGHVGWVPLAPYEPYYPWYGGRYYRGYHRGTYIDNSVNIVNNINVTNIYRNARVANAITSVDATQFGRGGAGNLVRMNPAEIQRVGLMKGQLPMVPGRESLRLSDRDVRSTTLPRNVEQGRFYSRREPAKVDRVPFEQQQRAMERIVRKTPEDTGVRAGGGRVRTPAGETPRGGITRDAGGNVSGVPVEDRSSAGWRGFGQPVSRPDATPGATPRVMDRSQQREPTRGGEGSVRNLPDDRSPRSTAPDNGSWRRFGEPVRERPGGPVLREETGRGVDRAPMQTAPRSGESIRGSEPSGGWQRFEQRGDTGPGRSAPETGGRGSDRGGVVRGGEQRYAAPRSESPRSESPRYESPRYERRGGGEGRVQISPPVVRERQAPRSEAPRSAERSRDFVGGGRVDAAPRGGGEVRSVPRGDGGGARGGGRR